MPQFPRKCRQAHQNWQIHAPHLRCVYMKLSVGGFRNVDPLSPWNLRWEIVEAKCADREIAIEQKNGGSPINAVLAIA